jgi:hypothetical protein
MEDAGEQDATRPNTRSKARTVEGAAVRRNSDSMRRMKMRAGGAIMPRPPRTDFPGEQISLAL